MDNASISSASAPRGGERWETTVSGAVHFNCCRRFLPLRCYRCREMDSSVSRGNNGVGAAPTVVIKEASSVFTFVCRRKSWLQSKLDFSDGTYKIVTLFAFWITVKCSSLRPQKNLLDIISKIAIFLAHKKYNLNSIFSFAENVVRFARIAVTIFEILELFYSREFMYVWVLILACFADDNVKLCTFYYFLKKTCVF